MTITLEESFQGSKKTIQLQGDDGKVKTVNVTIPQGIIDKQQIRLKGQGGVGATGQQGDLYIEVHLAPHPLFHRKKKDLYLKLPITPWEAALGASVTVPTLEKPVKLSIPKASQGGKSLRLKGKGLPGKPCGDLYVEIQIIIPTTIDGKDEELYRKLREKSTFNPRANLGV